MVYVVGRGHHLRAGGLPIPSDPPSTYHGTPDWTRGAGFPILNPLDALVLNLPQMIGHTCSYSGGYP